MKGQEGAMVVMLVGVGIFATYEFTPILDPLKDKLGLAKSFGIRDLLGGAPPVPVKQGTNPPKKQQGTRNTCIKSDTFPIGKENTNNPLLNKTNPYTWNQFFIPIQIQGADKTWKQFTAQLDSGADVTNLMKSTGDALGFTAAMGKSAAAMGVSRQSISMINMRINVKIGKLAPMNIEANIDQDGVLKNNFLGNQSLVTSGRFEYRLGKDSVTVYDKKASCNDPEAVAAVAVPPAAKAAFAYTGMPRYLENTPVSTLKSNY